MMKEKALPQKVGLESQKVKATSWFGAEATLNKGIDKMGIAMDRSDWLNKINFYEQAIEKFGKACEKAVSKFEKTGEGGAIVKKSEELEGQAYSELAKLYRRINTKERIELVQELEGDRLSRAVYGDNPPEIPNSPIHRTEKDELKFNAACVKFVDRLAETCERQAKELEEICAKQAKQASP